MRVFVTGGAGYVGTELVRRLADNAAVSEIVIYDNLSRENNGLFMGKGILSKKLTLVKGDILDSRTLEANLQNINVVYHLAARVSTPFANIDAHAFEQINHWGTAELVYACERVGIEHLVYLSSASVYGHRDELITNESGPQADSYYGVSKLRGEEHVHRAANAFKHHIIRLGNVYGHSASMRFDAVINRFLFDANFLGKVTIDGDGHQQRSFIHIDKVAQSLEQLLIKNVPSGTYNLSDQNLSILQIVDVLLELKPSLEFFLVGQHQRLKGHTISTDGGLHDLLDIKETTLKDELQEALTRFSF